MESTTHRSQQNGVPVAVVTGAGTGIGRAAAIALAAAGYSVVLNGRRRGPLAEVEASLVRREPTMVIEGDVADAGFVAAMFERIGARFGRLDAAILNAGIEGAFGPLGSLSAADFDATFAINTRGVWLCLKHAADLMARTRRGGSIVACSSWLAKGAMPGSSIYSASKGALDGMCRAAALELAPMGIRVNNVNPGIIDTPMFRRFAEPGTPEAAPFERHVPLARLGTPEEVGAVVAWLCSPSASYVTGQTILIDGGYAIPGHRP